MAAYTFPITWTKGIPVANIQVMLALVHKYLAALQLLTALGANNPTVTVGQTIFLFISPPRSAISQHPLRKHIIVPALDR